MLDRPQSASTDIRVPAPSIAPLFNEFNPATVFAEFCRNSAFQINGQIAQSWLHFLGARWLKDMRFPQQMAACKTADDVRVAVSEFWQQAYKDYQAEFDQLSDLTWAAMRNTLGGASALSSKEDAQCCGKCSSQQKLPVIA